MRRLALVFLLFILFTPTSTTKAAEGDLCSCKIQTTTATEPVTEVHRARDWVVAPFVVEGNLPSQTGCTSYCQSVVSSTSGSTLLTSTYFRLEDAPYSATPKLSVDIPGVSFSQPIYRDGVLEINFLAQYIAGIYRWLIGVAAVFAIIMIMVGGIQYMISAGGKEAKGGLERINNALIGFVILLGSYLLLYTVNPQLTILRPIRLQPIERESSDYGPGIVAHPELSAPLEQYKAMGCPSKSELAGGVTFFGTGYYKPSYGDKEAYQSFECNVGMQCSCPNGRSKTAVCSVNSGMKWHPCISFQRGTDYCNHTSSGVAPRAFRSAAVSGCINKGTVFKVFGSNQATANSTVWYAEDTGGAIKGRRIDMYTGEGPAAFQTAVQATGVITIKTCPDNDPAKCPTQ